MDTSDLGHVKVVNLGIFVASYGYFCTFNMSRTFWGVVCALFSELVRNSKTDHHSVKRTKMWSLGGLCDMHMGTFNIEYVIWVI